MQVDTIYLDSFTLSSYVVGYGTLGTNGSLGYEDKTVTVRGYSDRHALSAHPPARLRFQLDGRFRGFRCTVGLNDDVPFGRSHADFVVLADGRQVAEANFVIAGTGPRPLSADIAGAQTLELVTKTSRWEYSHAVWLDPQVSETLLERRPAVLVDCLRRAEITPPEKPLIAERVATVISPGVGKLLDDMLGSFYANSRGQDALPVIFALDADEACAAVAAKYQAELVLCSPIGRISAMSKAILYSAALVVEADQFLCLDTDMLVLGDLRPVFAALEACPEGAILACREGNGSSLHNYANLNSALCSLYGAVHSDWERFNGAQNEEGAYALVVNDGLFAASRPALLALDRIVAGMSWAPDWIDERHDIGWRNQFVFNLALAKLGCGVELDGIYNAQLNANDVQFADNNGCLQAIWNERSARVVHFNGQGRNKGLDWRKRFARVPDPLVAKTGHDHYNDFLMTLRAWVGRHGLRRPHAERTELWAALPAMLQACIEERSIGSLEGMAAALQFGEQYHGALLDSIHTEEHVWDEFQLAARLVCPGGLILIHDPLYAFGTVELALGRIEASGYNVPRLWAAESGIVEDDHLGLALIVNTRRSDRDAQT